MPPEITRYRSAIVARTPERVKLTDGPIRL